MKDKKAAILEYILDHCKIIFPIALIAVVAVTVVFALGIRSRAGEEPQDLSGVPISQPDTEGGQPLVVVDDSPLQPNEDGELSTLVATYYNATALGDIETLRELYDELPENNVLKIEETAQYIDYYSTLEIYTKSGLEEDSFIVCVFYRLLFVNHEEEFPGYETLYVCRDEQGGLYIKNEINFTAEESEYIQTVAQQDDVIEFNNRVNLEYNDLLREHPELLQYLDELNRHINVAVGERVAELEAAASAAQAPEGQEPAPDSDGGQEQQPASAPEPAGPQYATATTTVNVRSSDSEQADKLGKVTGGETVQVQEVGVNGWTKIVYEGKDGYIKSEYLQMQESAAGAEVIGTVTASTNLNVRASASETADRLGVLAGGETVDLLENLDGWCKIRYNDQVGYVKAEYVQQ
ncbi:MAG: SH3 domain-containing protein [Eubacterium sp.]|nr:SH3 domain-containing protein [Eubacterium sp.]MCM1217851.1 SH3 domain-containing protein [Lachnospiraceae bacterium]MCM1304649.1 SH3 domain-containing protein [Butyrivibrio sp.]MCM1344483.1 SH3 domain-containing protein [Muribaculaceae bacterium]MCM1240918.1 SH3 domain-containing protein [Lachnospiraceae bacterium]